jgi:hypothetical protein
MFYKLYEHRDKKFYHINIQQIAFITSSPAPNQTGIMNVEIRFSGGTPLSLAFIQEKDFEQFLAALPMAKTQ